MYTVLSPLRVPVSRNKEFILNLNRFRNTHYQTLNKAKIEYFHMITEQILALPKFEKIRLSYKVFAKDKRKFDLDNVCSIHAKFFQDSLAELGRIPEDNYLYVVESHHCFGGIDRDNPRVEITIEEVANGDE